MNRDISPVLPPIGSSGVPPEPVDAPPQQALDMRRLRALLQAPEPDSIQSGAAWADDLLQRLHAIDTPESAVALLPVLPSALAALLAALQDEDTSVQTLCDLISQDAVLVGETLRMANSAFVKPAQPISSLQQAISMLGLNGLRRIAMQLALQPLFLGMSTATGRHAAGHLWTEARLRAHLCALECPRSTSSFECFLAGLVGDVGLLAMLTQLGAAQPAAASKAQWRALVLESRRIGVLAAIHWKLPETVVAVLSRRAGMPVPQASNGLESTYAVAALACAIESPPRMDMIPYRLAERLQRDPHPWSNALQRALEELWSLHQGVAMA